MNLIHKIMFILLLLVALLITGMWIMLALNMDISREEMSKLRLAQIKESFFANLDRINTRQHQIENHTAEIAQAAQTFYHIKQTSQIDHQQEMELFLMNKTRLFPLAFGGGIWFEPYAYNANTEHFSIYSYWQKSNVSITRDYDNADYHNQDWYQQVLPADWERSQPRPQQFFWTDARLNTLLEAVVVSVNTPLHDRTGQIIGVAGTDWDFDGIIKLVGDVNVTDNSFAFLIDRQNRKLSSLSEDSSVELRDLMTQLSMSLFKEALANKQTTLASGREMSSAEITVNDVVYVLFFAQTHAGMVFGLSVPKDEIYAVIEQMRAVNYQVFAVTVLVMLMLSAIILYIVAGIMRLLDTLYTDSLTGLPNRLRLLQEIKGNRRGALILANIDSFKEINDFYGQRCGDQILQEFGERLRIFLSLESQNNAALYKNPSDEFAVFLRRAPESEQLNGLLSKMSDFVSAQIFHFEEQEINLSSTLGIALCGDSSHDLLLSNANMALRQAKRQRKSMLTYNDSMKIREEYEYNLTWGKKLKNAIREDRLVPYFQPISNNINDQVEKFECLVRLIEEDGSAITPGVFLGVAKKFKLSPLITRVMLEKSLATLRDSDYEISINLSYEDIIDPDTTGFIKQNLQDHQIARRVTFELLESESIANYEQVYTFIQDIKALGCHISIDDFGTGYSNFEHILRLDVDFIKIDGSLIKELDTDDNAYIITRSIVNFAKELNIRTTAEWVHSEAVLAKVKELNIDYAQGFYIGEPAPSLSKTPEHI